MMLVKPRLSLLVLFTVAVGYLLGCVANARPVVDLLALFNTVLGTALVAAGASALNQYLERDTDALMQRTKDRPLPAGRMQPIVALRFGVLSASLGFVFLALCVHPLPAFLSVVTLATYIWLYTPMKRYSTLNTVLGAIPGALPPVLGWTAATGSLSVEAGTLFLIIFLWQFPHFWAIAWLYREDYANAGMQMVPVLDGEQGRMTGRLLVNNILVLVAASMGPTLAGMAGVVYLAGATLLGLFFMLVAFRFLLSPSNERARHVLWASLLYLSLLMALLLLERPLLGT
jgi:protoheme IX farnesyltransferase